MAVAEQSVQLKPAVWLVEHMPDLERESIVETCPDHATACGWTGTWSRTEESHCMNPALESQTYHFDAWSDGQNDDCCSEEIGSKKQFGSNRSSHCLRNSSTFDDVEEEDDKLWEEEYLHMEDEPSLCERGCFYQRSCGNYQSNWSNCQRWESQSSWGDGSTTNRSSSDGEPEWTEDDEPHAPECKLIAKGAYRKMRRIGRGSFGDVFLVLDTSTGQSYAAKIGHQESVSWEAEVLRSLNGVTGFPSLHYHGVHDQESVLVMDCLGTNLSDLRQMCGGIFTLRSVLKIADQVLRRIEALHKAGFIHRDIKPENLIIGCGDEESMIYLIDFGVASGYRDKATRQRAPFSKHANFSGTPVYASKRAHTGDEQSWRDDLEAIGYLLVALLRGSLPWERDCKDNCSCDEWIEHCWKRKCLLFPGFICEGCPKAFSDYLRYCTRLKIDQAPDYEKLRGMFQKVLDREGFDDSQMFDWSHL